MKNIWNNNSWFSIVIAMGIVLFIWLAAIYLLEYVIPFGRNVKGIENASKSYYQANSWVEQSLWFIGQNNIGDEESRVLWPDATDYSYDITAIWSFIPLPNTGNSDFDNNYNTISQSDPIQLEVGNLSNNPNWWLVAFDINVPDTKRSATLQTLDWGSTPIVNWQISSPSNTLNSNNTAISATDINSTSTITLGSKAWIDSNGATPNFSTFYNANCRTQSCVLKLGVINSLTSGSTKIPYLEYRIDFQWDNIPLRFTQIHTSWKSSGFRKDLHIKVPQLTIDWAFDFTVLQ